MTTIKVYNGKTFQQMTDSEKQDLATKLVTNEIGSCFSNCFSTLFAAIDESHVEYDDMYSLSGAYDYETAVNEHLEGLDLGELYEVVDEHCDDEIKTKFVEMISKEFNEYLEAQTNEFWLATSLDDLLLNYADAESDMGQDEEEDETYINRVKQACIDYVANSYNIVNVLDWITTTSECSDHFGCDTDAIETACFEALDESGDLEDFSNENSLEPTFDEAYEHWIVSPWLADKLSHTGDVCGLTIWARYTTGQSICLDHEIQMLAFDIYCEEVDESEHIKKVDAIKAIITASCKKDVAPFVESVIIENESAYSLAVNNAPDYEQRKTLEKRISNNVKKVREVLESHNITL